MPDRMPLTREFNPRDRQVKYELPDNELAIGSTLGGPKAACIVKATGAIAEVYAIDSGKTLLGTVLLRHYNQTTGMGLTPTQTGTFTLYPERQEHAFMLPGQLHVHETIFVLSSKIEEGDDVDPPGVYLCAELRNDGSEPISIASYLYAGLSGDTGHDVVAEYDAGIDGLVIWNESHPEWVRVLGCSKAPESHETTLDYGKVVAAIDPGTLSNTTDAVFDPVGALRHVHRIKPGQSVKTAYLISFGNGRAEALANYHACPSAAEAQRQTTAHYQDALGRSVVMTPNPQINWGVLWAKANMLRVMVKSPTGWCFVNDPTRSNNSVGRDTAWFAYGGDYFNPAFVRESLLAYVHNQETSGKVVEYYDIRNGKTADYGLNINDNTPLLILALWHHYKATGDEEFLRGVYPAAVKAAKYILSQRNEQGLVWCTSTGTSDWGIIGWRNVIENYRLSGATTEVNSECHAALRTVSHMARVLERHEESAAYMAEAEALKLSINTHLKNPQNDLYYLNIDVDGSPRSDVTSDLVFPVMMGVADDETSAHIISRLSDADFWTAAGMRTTPRDAINYAPKAGWGLVGGVWVGVSFWFAFAAARYNREFMNHALSASFRNFSIDPRRNSTVPGQFSEWLHGETLTNEGMMLSPWDPPRYLWAAVEGVGGFVAESDHINLNPSLSDDWKWLGVKNLPYRGKWLTYFAVRTPELRLYTTFHPQSASPYYAYEEDISAHIKPGLETVCALGLRQGDSLVLFLGNTSEQTVNTSIRVDCPLQGAYRLRVFESLLGQWSDRGVVPAAQFQSGHVLKIERRGFSLLELQQEI